MKSFSLHKHRRKVIAVIISSVIFTCICRYVYLSNSSTTVIQDIDLLGKFCNQHENWQFHQPLQMDPRKRPQWISDKSMDDNSALFTERDSTSHLYKGTVQPDLFMDDDVWDGLPVKGAFYMIVKNEELQLARSSMRSIEDRFNSHNASYPWVLLNSQHFTSDFKRYTSRMASGKVYFGHIDLEAWTYPEWIDAQRTENAIRRMVYLGVKKSHSLYQRQEMRYLKINYSCLLLQRF